MEGGEELVFSSLEFLFWFLPFFLLVYFILPVKYRNACIAFYSICFYLCGSLDYPVYVLLIAVSTIINYMIARGIEKQKKHKKLFLITGLLYNFGILFIFKYLDFFIAIINSLMNRFHLEKFAFTPVKLVLPVGISFFTFQIASYLIDVYWGKVKAERNLIDLSAYILMFPQLIAGPIVRFSDIREKLKYRLHSLKKVADGIRIFIIGLGFKVLLANRIGTLWHDINTIGYDSISTPLAWMGIAAFSFQIYFDFYGYSLMASGLGKIIGFHFPQNFRLPYCACTMTDFWRRWHITLGSWFREYVYIPLGGNRRGRVRTYFNMFVVWLLTGFWHGADWNFIFWGLFLFMVLCLEKTGYGKWMEKHRIFGHLYMIILIPVSWLLFAIDSIPLFITYIKRLCGFEGENVFSGDIIKYIKLYGMLLVIGLLFCTPLPGNIYKKISGKWFSWIIIAAIFGGAVYYLYLGLNNPFLYFRF